jgi:transposase InsO family protein
MSASDNNIIAQIGKLDGQGKNFSIWKMKVLACFDALGLSDVLEAPAPSIPKSRMSIGNSPVASTPVKTKPEEPEEKKVQAKASKAYAIFIMSLSDEALQSVMHIPRGNAYEIWQALLKRYESKTTASKTHTRDMLHKCRMEHNEAFDKYVSRITQYVISLEEMGETVSKGELMYVLFNGLPSTYESLVQTLKVNDKVEFEEACTHIREYQEKLTLQGKSSTNDDGHRANLTQEYERNHSQRGPFRGRGAHSRSRGRGRGTGRGRGQYQNTGNRNWKQDNHEAQHSNTNGKKHCAVHGYTYHSTDECHAKRNNQRGTNPGPSTVKDIRNEQAQPLCYNCQQYGHMAKQCHNPRKERANTAIDEHKNSQHQHQAQKFPTQLRSEYTGCAVDSEETLIAACQPPETPKWYWVLDQGATSHYVNNMDMLTHIQELTTPTSIRVANGQTVTATHTGESTLTHDGKKLVLKNVKYCNQLTDNLLSVSKLDKNGAELRTKNGKTEIIYGNTVVAVAKMVGNLYYVQSDTNIHDTAHTIKDQVATANYKLLHSRLGHLSLSSIKSLCTEDAYADNKLTAAELEQISNDSNECICEACQLGKSHRLPFKDYTSRPAATKLLERIHCDLSGPINIKIMNQNEQAIFKSLGEPRYVSLIVDERSRMIFGRLLRTKSEAADHIIEFITQAENETEQKVKYFHADGGAEYNNSKLQQYFKDKGIKMDLTTRSTPQHNGIAERCNRSVFESTRTMLYDAKLSTVFWGEATMTAIHLLNHRLAVNDKHRTPLEIWYGHKPHISRLRTFGCDAYVHILDEERTKMDAKAIKCVFVGYDQLKSQGYRFYDTTQQKILVRRDAIFNDFSFTAAQQITQSGSNHSISPKHAQFQHITITLGLSEQEIPSEAQHNMEHEQVQDMQEESGHEYDSHNIKSHTPGPGNQASDMMLSSTRLSTPKTDYVTDGMDTTAHHNRIPHSTPVRNLSTEELATWGQISARELQEQKLNGTESKPAVTQPEPKPESISTRSRRNVSVPARLGMVNYESGEIYDDALLSTVEHIANTDPLTYEEAMSRPDADKWKEAINKELQSLKLHNTYLLTVLPKHAHAIGCKWVLKTKYKSDGKIDKYKARLVAKGYSQQEGIDYHETFSPVVKYKSLRIIMSIANYHDLELNQLDVETAFLNADMKEDVYMSQPKGFETGGANMVWKLNKTLYGTKQANREWNSTINDYIVKELGFKRLFSDTCIYSKQTKVGGKILIALFVDDIVCAYHKHDEQEWKEYKAKLSTRFKIEDKRECKWILGMTVIRDRKNKTLQLNQQMYIEKVIKRFGMENCKPTSTPEAAGVKLNTTQCPTTEEQKIQMKSYPYEAAVGSLLYASIATRPDISHAVNEVSRYMKNPGIKHWEAVKHILRYLKGTADQSLVYSGKQNPNNSTHTNYAYNIQAYTDADWGGDIDTRKSTTGYVVKLNGDTISWSSKKQATVATSSAEAEYMAIAATAQEVRWVQQLLYEIHNTHPISTIIYCDNQAAIAISKNDIHHERTKHIDIRYHFIRDYIDKNILVIQWISTENQLADVLTKGLNKILFNKLCNGIMNVSSDNM